MKLGIACIDTAFMARPAINLDLVRHAENLGFDSAWAAEAYGSDAVSSATWIAAHTKRIKVGTSIMQMPARTPASAAMTAMGLDALSNGRFILGLGSSGPQVVEGWHGVAYHKPLTRTREYVDIVRKILARKEVLTHEGYHYQLPFTGEHATGAGKPLKSVAHGNPEQPIYLASISPGGIRCAAEIADGVLLSFIDPQSTSGPVDQYLAEGFAKPGAHCQRETFTVSTMVNVVVADDLEAVYAMMKPTLARQLGGMGSRSKNFYAEFAARIGYADEVARVQDCYLAGDKQAAADAVPEALLDATSLVGPAERIRERLGAWREAGERGALDLMILTALQPEALTLVAEEML